MSISLVFIGTYGLSMWRIISDLGWDLVVLVFKEVIITFKITEDTYGRLIRNI